MVFAPERFPFGVRLTVDPLVITLELFHCG